MSKTQDKRLERRIEQAEFLWERAQVKAASAQSVLDYMVEQFNKFKEELTPEQVTATEEQIAIRQKEIEDFIMEESEEEPKEEKPVDKTPNDEKANDIKNKKETKKKEVKVSDPTPIVANESLLNNILANNFNILYSNNVSYELVQKIYFLISIILLPLLYEKQQRNQNVQ